MQQPPLTCCSYPSRRGSGACFPSFVCTPIRSPTNMIHLFPTNSAQEREIIKHPSSCYVIGGSSTGKTTTMLFKMLGIEHAWQQYPHIGQKPRQVFITGSRVRASKAEEGFAKLMSSLEALGYSSEEPRTMQKDVEQETDFMDLDDNQQWMSDLPERFSELLDDHFPLFITYDRVRTSPSLKHPTSPFCE